MEGLRMSKITAELLKDILPHGSGIDCDWQIEDKGNYIRCDNSYHVMNDTGYYIGWLDFSVIVPKKAPKDFRIHFHTNSTGRRWIQQLDLKEALTDNMDYRMKAHGL
jgi:hypothetical protein